MKEEEYYNHWIKLFVLFIISLLCLRIFPALWGAVGVGVVLLLLFVIAFLLFKGIRSTTQTQADSPFSEQIKQRIQQCQRKRDAFRTEAETIRQSYTELQRELEQAKSATPTAQKKGQQLLKELAEEQALRLSKAQFFDSSIAQLEGMLSQHRLHETLLAKEAQLDRLREKNFEDVADMENVRYQLEQDRIRLETVTDLTHRAATSPSLNQTELLRAELTELFS
ncbi:MAG: hypothetical protein AAF828_08650 [Bacteroidota bacterium]